MKISLNTFLKIIKSIKKKSKRKKSERKSKLDVRSKRTRSKRKRSIIRSKRKSRFKDDHFNFQLKKPLKKDKDQIIKQEEIKKNEVQKTEIDKPHESRKRKRIKEDSNETKNDIKKRKRDSSPEIKKRKRQKIIDITADRKLKVVNKKCICMGKFTKSNKKTKLSCGHRLHEKCLSSLKHSNICPFCQKQIKDTYIRTPLLNVIKNSDLTPPLAPLKISRKIRLRSQIAPISVVSKSQLIPFNLNSRFNSVASKKKSPLLPPTNLNSRFNSVGSRKKSPINLSSRFKNVLSFNKKSRSKQNTFSSRKNLFSKTPIIKSLNN